MEENYIKYEGSSFLKVENKPRLRGTVYLEPGLEGSCQSPRQVLPSANMKMKIRNEISDKAKVE